MSNYVTSLFGCQHIAWVETVSQVKAKLARVNGIYGCSSGDGIINQVLVGCIP